MTADPYQSPNATHEPAGWNRYAYVIGDPVNLYDPFGLDYTLPPGGTFNPGDPRNVTAGQTSITVTAYPFGSGSSGPQISNPGSIAGCGGGVGGGKDGYQDQGVWDINVQDDGWVNDYASQKAVWDLADCSGQALRENAASLALDAAGFIQGAGATMAMVQLGVNIASTLNSASTGDVSGALPSLTGLQTAAYAEFARLSSIRGLAAIPVIETIVNVASALKDLNQVWSDTQDCVKRK